MILFQKDFQSKKPLRFDLVRLSVGVQEGDALMMTSHRLSHGRASVLTLNHPMGGITTFKFSSKSLSKVTNDKFTTSLDIAVAFRLQCQCFGDNYR